MKITIIQIKDNTIIVTVRSAKMKNKTDIKMQKIKNVPILKSDIEKVTRQQVAVISKYIQILSIVIKHLQTIRGEKMIQRIDEQTIKVRRVITYKQNKKIK